MTGNSEFKLKNIILTESHFKRQPEINFGNNFKNDIDLVVNYEEKDNVIGVELRIKFIAGQNPHKSPKIEALVKMIGVFEFSEIPDYGLEKFSEINAAAIIFPFVREHLASVSMKAGLTPIILPPVNFVKLYEERKKKKNEQTIHTPDKN